MEFGNWVSSVGTNGRQRDYLIGPIEEQDVPTPPAPIPKPEIKIGHLRLISGITEEPEAPHVVTEADIIDGDLEIIREAEADEGTRSRRIRRLVDGLLDWPGALALSVVGASATYENGLGLALTAAAAIGSAALQEVGRRPFIGARHSYHQGMDPWSPAAQSTALLRKKILDERQNRRDDAATERELRRPQHAVKTGSGRRVVGLADRPRRTSNGVNGNADPYDWKSNKKKPLASPRKD